VRGSSQIKAPRTNLQAPDKHQTPSSNQIAKSTAFPDWDLKFAVSLPKAFGLGCSSLVELGRNSALETLNSELGTWNWNSSDAWCLKLDVSLELGSWCLVLLR
jgi:hypothetical protein